MFRDTFRANRPDAYRRTEPYRAAAFVSQETGSDLKILKERMRVAEIRDNYSPPALFIHGLCDHDEANPISRTKNRPFLDGAAG